jgi:hypothetical protein
MKISHKMKILVVVSSVVLASAMLLWPLRTWINSHVERQKEQWMTIFVHGSFGTLIGFLNFSKVFNDQISGTEYEKIVGRMRDDEFYFSRQPILQLGLVSFEPTMNIKDVRGEKLAVYPIAKAYETVLETVFPDKEKNYFYTFGWSGLLSQTNRRSEAIRFYNALCEEITSFHKKGIDPKIRIICHSHGGNLAINLAAVQKTLTLSVGDPAAVYSTDADENEALREMVNIMKELPTKENARFNLGQEVWDYVPMARDVAVDELILYGVPIQSDTECFCYSPFFKRIFNFYSDEDWVQRFDWVSTKKHISRQRIARRDDAKKNDQHIIQAKIMVARPVVDEKIVIEESKNPAATASAKKEQSIFDMVFEGRGAIARQSNDPTHKEMWFLMWENESEGFTSPLFPLPVVVLTPLFIAALNNVPEIIDADIDFDMTSDAVRAHVARHNEFVIEGGARMPLFYIKRLQRKVMAWRPEKDTPMDEFNTIYKYLH